MAAPLSFRYGTAEHRAWLLGCAARLERAGDHELAAEARADAATCTTPPAPRPAPPIVARVRCEDCGAPTPTRRMPEDWPFDWWSHKLEGRACARRTR